MTSFDMISDASTSPHNDCDPAERSQEPPRKVLIIVHRRESKTGNVGHWLTNHGYQLDVRCPHFGDPLPQSLSEHAGAIIFGGPMSANDPDDFIGAEIDWLNVPLRENKPFLGICLGAQMLAKNLGGEVRPHKEALVEVGYYPILPSKIGEALLPWPEKIYQWHREGFTLPSGAEHLAATATFENQAFRYGESAYGVQFHPEMNLAMIHRWTVNAAHRLTAPNAKPRDAHLAEHEVCGIKVRSWLDRFMRIWLKLEQPADNQRLENGLKLLQNPDPDAASSASVV